MSEPINQHLQTQRIDIQQRFPMCEADGCSGKKGGTQSKQSTAGRAAPLVNIGDGRSSV